MTTPTNSRFDPFVVARLMQVTRRAWGLSARPITAATKSTLIQFERNHHASKLIASAS
jgi:hypothetical protein